MPPGSVFWVTGLPGSGKSTLALAAKDALPSLAVIQMDEMRRVVTPDPTYSESERDLLYMALVYTAMVLSREGKDVIVDATANMRRWRDEARARIPRFHEVYVRCPIAECRKREMARTNTLGAPHDIYLKAEEGWPVPGVNAPYEEPEAPELVIDNGTLPLDDAAAIFVGYIRGETEG
ncbi:MAG TPA: adenylyl-sulfate kinase [Nitrospirota bacterium]|jgi:adenylylsulfate kinase